MANERTSERASERSGTRIWTDLVHRAELLDGAVDGARVAHGLDDVARARLALGAQHRRALGDAAQRLAETLAAADEGGGELVLVRVVAVVGHGEHLALVDEVHAHRLQHLRLHEVPDARLGSWLLLTRR